MVLLRTAWAYEMLCAARAYQMPHAAWAYKMPLSAHPWATEDYDEDQQKNKPAHQHPVWFYQHSTIVGDFSKFLRG